MAVKLPTDYGDFDLHLYHSKTDGQHHLALVRGASCRAKKCSGARPQRMSDRRCLRLAPLRLRPATASGHAADRRRRPRRDRLYAAGRPRHRPRAENQGLQIAGTGLRHRGGERKARLRHGPARIRPRRANPRGPRLENHPAADQQSKKNRRPGGLRIENCRAGADSREAESAQRTVFENETGQRWGICCEEAPVWKIQTCESFQGILIPLPAIVRSWTAVEGSSYVLS